MAKPKTPTLPKSLDLKKDEEQNGFDWVKAEKNGAIVVETQGAIAIFINSRKQLVIMQEGRFEEEDRAIFINKEYVEAVIAEMQKIAKEM